jgi:hypothetical protein
MLIPPSRTMPFSRGIADLQRAPIGHGIIARHDVLEHNALNSQGQEPWLLALGTWGVESDSGPHARAPRY